MNHPTRRLLLTSMLMATLTACAPKPQGESLPAIETPATPVAAAAAPVAVEPAPLDLAGSAWRLLQFRGGDDTVEKPDDPSHYTVIFEQGGRVAVRFDCNRGNGSWTYTPPSSLTFGALALTRAMCPPSAVYTRLTRQWESIRSFVLKDGHLHLALMADGGTFEFEPMPATASVAASLENTRWKLLTVDGKPVVMTGGQREPHLSLQPDKHAVAGFSGCNNLAGGYTLNGASLSFSQMAMTMMACEHNMETEQAFTAALRKVASWRITGEKLDLLDAGQAVVAQFESVYLR
jgi:heat shock protein HslJ